MVGFYNDDFRIHLHICNYELIYSLEILFAYFRK